MKKILLLLIFATVFLAKAQNNYSILSIPKELSEKTNSVILDELIEIDVSKKSSLIYKFTSAVAILNKLGDSYINPSVAYDPSSRVKNVEAYVYDALGKEIAHYKKKDFKDVSSADGISIYSDDRVLYLDYTPTTYPYIFVFSAETESSDTAFIPSWYPVVGFTQSCKKCELKVTFDPLNKPKIKKSNLDGLDIKIMEGISEISIIAENIKAIQYEDLGPSFNDIAPKVNFALDNFYLKGTPGVGKDWKEFGSWMDKNLLQDVQELPVATVARMKNLVANETTNEGKAKKIYQYLQDKVRYVSVQIGIGGWKPINAMEVDKLSYGDCKALSNYTKSLLASVGVPSYYTVLYAGNNERDIQNDFTAIQGNHAMLAVPNNNEMIWLECTSQDTPFGYGGNFNDDRDVLVITPEGGEIMHTKIYTYIDNTQRNTGTVIIDETGGAMANVDIKSAGLRYDDKYSIEKGKKNEIEASIKNRWAYLNSISIHKLDFQNDRDNILFTEKLNLNIPNYCTAVSKDLLLCPNIFNQAQDIPPRFTDRKQDLHLDMGYRDLDEFEIEIPQNYSFDAFPEETLLETKFGSYKISFKKISENKMAYSRELIIKKGKYAPIEYDNYRDFRRQIAKLDKTKILLKQKIN